MAEKTYPLQVDADRWERIKNTVARNDNLNDELLRRLEAASFAEEFERTADNRGRVKLPDSEYAERDVVVLVADVDDLQDGESEAVEAADG